jgi:arginase family enzyme
MVLDCAAIQQAGIRNALEAPLSKISAGAVEEVHLHIDLDALNPKEAPANGFLMDQSGLSVQQLREAIARIKETSNITSATVASFDPSYDSEGQTLQAAVEFIKQIVDTN